MRIVIAPDKFKGSLTSLGVCNIVELAIKSVIHDCEIVKLPLSDGGDGFEGTILHYLDAKVLYKRVLDPLFNEIDSSWLVSRANDVAFIEMAKASGLQLLRPSEYNCSITTSYGTGQLIQEAIGFGVHEIILGVGGSATNDGGMGMAAALGYRFLDDHGRPLSPVGRNLIHLVGIDCPKRLPDKNLRFVVACDVNNYLCGEFGAAKMFARQKGATDLMIEELEEGMLHYLEVVKRDLGIDLSEIKGGGAAGGLAAGCVAFLNAEITSGADLILGYCQAKKYIQASDAVITGEGILDQQTLNGKLVAKVCALSQKLEKRIFILCGIAEISSREKENLGVRDIYQLVDMAKSKEESIARTSELLYKTSMRLASSIRQI